MTLLTCSAVRRRLAAFYDRELPITDLISVEGHLNDCPPCARELRELAGIGDALRLAAAPGPADDWTGLAAGVVNRMTRGARGVASRPRVAAVRGSAPRLDWPRVDGGQPALRGDRARHADTSRSPARHDSLAGVFAVMAAPSGSDLNPARLDYRYSCRACRRTARSSGCSRAASCPTTSRATTRCWRSAPSSRATAAWRICRS